MASRKLSSTNRRIWPRAAVPNVRQTRAMDKQLSLPTTALQCQRTQAVVGHEGTLDYSTYIVHNRPSFR